jgi:hypothetical protein
VVLGLLQPPPPRLREYYLVSSPRLAYQRGRVLRLRLAAAHPKAPMERSERSSLPQPFSGRLRRLLFSWSVDHEFRSGPSNSRRIVGTKLDNCSAGVASFCTDSEALASTQSAQNRTYFGRAFAPKRISSGSIEVHIQLDSLRLITLPNRQSIRTISPDSPFLIFSLSPHIGCVAA